MIGTIRKHSKWLLWVIAGATIFSFLFFMSVGPARNGGGGGTASVNTNIVSGEIYGQKITQDMYDRAYRDVDLNFLFRYGQWASQYPNKNAVMQEVYIQMMFLQKAKQVGIHVSDDEAQQEAAARLRSPELLRALGVNNQQSIPFGGFVKQVLTPENLTAADFGNYVRDDLALGQLQLTYGLPGLLITPQEAATEYVRQYEELSSQIVFFSASNFLSRVRVNPDEVGLYYTNYMANYRLPNRVQVSYVEFSASNYLGRAEKELTNLDAQVTAIFARYGMQATPDATTTNEAIAQIRHVLLLKQGLGDAAEQASDFAQAVFNVSNGANKAPSADDLSTMARQKGLAIQTPAPFSANYGPEEFAAPPAFVRQAFELTPDSPISEPVAGTYSIYVMALDTNLPSEIPPFVQIHNKVMRDMQLQEAMAMAQRAGTNFVHNVFLQMAAGKSFIASCVAEGFEPQSLPPFSLATQEMPELDNHTTLNQLKQVAVATPVGMASGFVPTDDGGFVLYAESRLPVDQSKMAADLPQFTAQLRQQREVQIFGDWYQREANRQLHDTPLARMK
ncbi:MAG TPA: SurA N-terminal domain-containing protein [Candidatus Acidoferrum sp.]|nr:SurA N-terminal domain-containing protein [Candidatus Acidoferrum sp.]